MARTADEIAQYGDIGTVGADATSVHRQAQAFGKIQINAGIIEFGKTETRRRLHAVQS